MRILTIGATRIQISPLLLFLIPILVTLGAVSEMLTAFLSLSLHEACHALIAHGLGYGIAAIEIQPFGFVARLDEGIRSPVDEFAIAAAGPVGSLVIFTAATAAIQAFPELQATLQPFSRFNLSLAMINLLPALPLDGGRITRALLSVFLRPRVAVLLCAGAGVVMGSLLFLLGILASAVGEWNLSAIVMGFFLMIAAAKELRLSRTAQLNAMMRRSGNLRRGERLRLCHTAAHMSMTAGEALRLCSMNQYNLILVVDDSMRALGEIDEGMLLAGIAQQGVGCPLGELLKRLH